MGANICEKELSCHVEVGSPEIVPPSISCLRGTMSNRSLKWAEILNNDIKMWYSFEHFTFRCLTRKVGGGKAQVRRAEKKIIFF